MLDKIRLCECNVRQQQRTQFPLHKNPISPSSKQHPLPSLSFTPKNQHPVLPAQTKKKSPDRNHSSPHCPQQGPQGVKASRPRDETSPVKTRRGRDERGEWRVTGGWNTRPWSTGGVSDCALPNVPACARIPSPATHPHTTQRCYTDSVSVLDCSDIP